MNVAVSVDMTDRGRPRAFCRTDLLPILSFLWLGLRVVLGLKAEHGYFSNLVIFESNSVPHRVDESLAR